MKKSLILIFVISSITINTVQAQKKDIQKLLEVQANDSITADMKVYLSWRADAQVRNIFYKPDSSWTGRLVRISNDSVAIIGKDKMDALYGLQAGRSCCINVVGEESYWIDLNGKVKNVLHIAPANQMIDSLIGDYPNSDNERLILRSSLRAIQIQENVNRLLKKF